MVCVNSTPPFAVQLCKASKGKLTTKSISDATAMIEQLGNLVADLRDKRDKLTTVISEELHGTPYLAFPCYFCVLGLLLCLIAHRSHH